MSTASIAQSESSTVQGAPQTNSRARIFILLLIAIWAAIYITSLFQPPLLDDADTVHAEAARNMLLRHDWVTLYIDAGINPPANGVRYLEKAPLPYWLVAICYKFFGVSEWTTRLPLALGVLALAFYLFYVGRRIYGEEAGLYAGLVIVTSFGVYLFTRFLIPDILVGLWLAIACGFFLQTLNQEEPSRTACWGLAIACALNVLTKGLIGLAFPAGIIFIYLLLTRNLRHLLRMRLVSSFLIFLAVGAPWHIAATLQNPPAGESKGFFWFYFINEHFKRFLGTRIPKDYDTVPLALFWLLTLVWLLPWSAFIPQAVAQLRSKLNQLDQRGRANLLFLIWALLIYVFFSFSTRQEYYILPTFPALALLIGGWLGRESAAAPEEKIRRTGRISAVILFAFGVAAFAACIALALESKAPSPGTDIAVLLQQRPGKYALSMGHFLDLTPQALGAFRGPLIGTGIAFLVGTFLSWIWRKRGRILPANLALALMMVAMLYCAHLGLIIFSPTISSKDLAIAIEHQYRPGDVVEINGNLEAGSSLPFYTGIQARLLGPQNNAWYGSLFPDAPHIYDNDDSFRRLWNSPTRVFFFSEMDHLKPELLRNPVYQVAQRGGKIVLSNQPNR